MNLPDVAWTSARDGTRAPGDLEDLAARYHPGRHELTINAHFRAITDLIAHWRDRYRGVPGAHATIKAQVREWCEQILVEVVLAASNSHWDTEQLDALLSPSSFTAVLLPRQLLHATLQKRLAQKLGAPAANRADQRPTPAPHCDRFGRKVRRRSHTSAASTPYESDGPRAGAVSRSRAGAALRARRPARNSPQRRAAASTRRQRPSLGRSVPRRHRHPPLRAPRSNRDRGRAHRSHILESPDPLREAQRAHWTIHHAFVDYQNAAERRRELAAEVGEVAGELVSTLVAAGWSEHDARRARVHDLASGSDDGETR